MNKMWFLHRAGRVPASNIKAAARTNHSMPSQSLIKRLCYPEAFKFSTKATRYVLLICKLVNILTTIHGVHSYRPLRKNSSLLGGDAHMSSLLSSPILTMLQRVMKV